MTLSASEIESVCTEASPALEGGWLQNIHLTAETLILSFRVERENRFILLCASRGFQRLHLVRTRPDAPREPPDFCLYLRRQLKGRRLVSLRQLGGDRIAELRFSRRSEGDGPGLREDGPCLVHELFGPGNLIVLDPKRRILSSLRPVAGSQAAKTRAANSIAAISKAGGSKAGGSKAATSRAGGSSGEIYRLPKYREEPKRSERTVALSGEEFPLSYGLETHYIVRERAARLEDGRTSLGRRLQQELKRRGRALQKVEADLMKAESRERDREIGELLKGSFSRLKRGMSQIRLVDYFSPDMSELTVELDSSRSPQENIERYFKRYSKSRRALGFLEERRGRLASELERIEELIENTAAVSSIVEVEAIEKKARGLIKPSHRAKKKTATPAASGPRQFVARNGQEILVGRSARQNDELTMRLARGNDLFFHVAGRPGAHVILRTRPGHATPPEALQDAALLALYYSFSKRSQGSLDGARADVDYTPVKYVHKPRGARPGLVLLASHKTIRSEFRTEHYRELTRWGREGQD